MRKARTSTEVLKAALWILENVGWTRGSFHEYGEDGKIIAFCAGEAIRTVEVTEDNVGRNARKRLDASLPKKYDHLIDFNDHPKTTKKMIINLFKKALKEKK